MKKEYNCFNTRKIALLSHTNKGWKDTFYVFMHAIDEEIEKDIDDSMNNISKRAIFSIDDKIIASGRNILAYGTVDLRKSEDIELIEKLSIVNDEVMPSYNWIPSNFDYIKGTISTEDDGKVRWYTTWDNLKWFKYNYCLIGKPKRIIIFKITPKEYNGIYNTLFKSLYK